MLSNKQPTDLPRATKTIKFDMKTDDEIRAVARKGYELSKIFKEAGLSIKKIVPASTDDSIKKLFHLKSKTDLLCIEINKPEDEEKSFDVIGEVKDQLLMMNKVRLVDEKPYTLSRGNVVYRFLIKI